MKVIFELKNVSKQNVEKNNILAQWSEGTKLRRYHHLFLATSIVHLRSWKFYRKCSRVLKKLLLSCETSQGTVETCLCPHPQIWWRERGISLESTKVSAVAFYQHPRTSKHNPESFNCVPSLQAEKRNTAICGNKGRALWEIFGLNFGWTLP